MFAQGTLSRHVANYDMHVHLDTDARQMRCTTYLTWINPSADTVSDLHLHLYYNAFKHSRSTWISEDRRFMDLIPRAWKDECGWGWTQITSFTDLSGNELSGGFVYIQPDDGNPDDETVLYVPLTVPVMPYDTARFVFTWSAKVPKTMVRTGYNKDFWFFAQWFPKLGVYEPAGMRYATTGGWNCHQYHNQGEYYADFGVYEVHIDVPAQYHVGASGILLHKEESNVRTTWTYLAEDVIDFAWTASPHFMTVEDQWKDVDIRLLLYPDQKCFIPRYQTAIQHVFDFMHKHVGVYPYVTLTVVDPPVHGMFTGGMEYPTLITAFSSRLLPKGFRSIETLVVHEFIHQYFMQMIATHEVEEPWMDEGITSYYEARILDFYYGEKTSMFSGFGVSCGNLEFTRHEFFSSGTAQLAPHTNRSWEFRHGGYYMISYNKVVLWLTTLEHLLGQEIFDETMRTYIERWKFRHPTRHDFVAVFNEVTKRRLPETFPDGLDWFFAQMLEGTEICDYAVASIENLPVRPHLGYLSDTVHCITPADVNSSSTTYDTRVILHRRGGIQLPVQVRIDFDDGSSVLEHWDGKSRTTEFSYRGAKRITCAVIDPDRHLVLDVDYNNNSMAATPQRRALRAYFARSMTVFQHFIETLSLLM